MTQNKKITRRTLPPWADPALQGIAYWMGYKSQYDREFDLPEAAIVAELHTLISMRLKDQKIECEIDYNSLHDSKAVNDTRYADMVIYDKENKRPLYAIEVKRYKTGYDAIKKDIEKLRSLQHASGILGKYLIVTVPQKGFPTKLITDQGVAPAKLHESFGKNVYVRRVCKASNSFRHDAVYSAQYAILIEVK